MKGDSPSQHGLETKSVFDEDLQKKIIENERLHIQVSCPVATPFSTSADIEPILFAAQFYEADEKHKKQEAELKSRLQELEKDSEQHQAIVDGLTTKYMDTIERLQGDKARLEVGLVTMRRKMVMKFLRLIKVHLHICLRMLTFWQVKAQMLERETKECRVRTEEWYVLF